jgi:hypothetical protein
MANTSAICASFIQELLAMTPHTAADTFKIALFTSSAGLDHTKTAYAGAGSEANELATANGYTQGGISLVGFTTGVDTKTAWIDFTTDPSWAAATFTGANAALIYNSSRSNKAVAVFAFGADKAGGGGTFTLQLPTAAAATALIRFVGP